jgi:uncharacterized protein YbaP (TraB family)
MEQVQSLKPWALMFALGGLPGETAQSRDKPVLDEWLELDAMSRSIPVYGLETVEEHAAVLNGMSEADQVALLAEALADLDTLEESYNQLMKDYLARDLAALHATLTEHIPPGQERLYRVFERRMLTDRNSRMVTRMQKRLREGGAFIAIGAGHLPGELGILNLLRQRGYKITCVY